MSTQSYLVLLPLLPLLPLLAAGLAGCSSSPSTAQGTDAGLGSNQDSSFASSGSGSASSGGGGNSGAPSGSGSGSPSGGSGADALEGGPLESSTAPDADGAAGGGDAGAPDSGSEAGARAHTGVWRIMPLGDSITGSMCPPQLLSQQLKNNGRTNFLFVGSNLNNQSCFGAPNVQTEGHGGYLVTDLVGNGQHATSLPQWCAADRADVVLMLFGTNDAWNSRSTQSILDAYSVVLTDLRAVNASVILFVGQITPLNPSGCANCETNVQNLNAQIPAWASSQSTASSPVYVVDVHSAFTASAYVPNSMYTADGVHPNPAGSRLVADKWYNALTAHGLP